MEIYIKCFGRNQAILRNLSNEVRDMYIERDKKKYGHLPRHRNQGRRVRGHMEPLYVPHFAPLVNRGAQQKRQAGHCRLVCGANK